MFIWKHWHHVYPLNEKLQNIVEFQHCQHTVRRIFANNTIHTPLLTWAHLGSWLNTDFFYPIMNSTSHFNLHISHHIFVCLVEKERKFIYLCVHCFSSLLYYLFDLRVIWLYCNPKWIYPLNIEYEHEYVFLVLVRS